MAGPDLPWSPMQIKIICGLRPEPELKKLRLHGCVPTQDNNIAEIRAFTAPGVTKVLQITIRLSKIHCSPYKFKKKNRPVKKWTIWGTFGPEFPFFFN
jgi:hypothetical protein